MLFHIYGDFSLYQLLGWVLVFAGLIVANVLVLGFIIKRAKAQGINPYTHEVWKGTPDFEEAMARAEK